MSLVIYGNEFGYYIQQGLIPSNFKYKFLVEGDSWMDRSAILKTSLLQKLAPEMDESGVDCLFINIAVFGDTMRNIGDCASVDFKQWVNTDFSWHFDAVLLSAGGNDVIDAATTDDLSIDFLRHHDESLSTAEDYIKQDVLQDIFSNDITPGFRRLNKVLRNSRNAKTPIFLNL